MALLAVLTACSGGVGGPASPTPIAPIETSPPLTATPDLPTALSVNGEVITTDEFNAEVARYNASQTALGKQPTEEEAAGAVSETYITQLLLAQGAREAGFTLDDVVLQTRIDALAAKLGGAEKLSAWQQAHGYGEQSFRDALRREAAAAWMRDKIASSVPSTAEQVHVRQILLYNQDNAQTYWDRLQAGAEFETVAAQVDPLTRGDLGWIPRGYLAEKSVEDAAFALEPDQYSDIIQDRAGFHILQLIERQADRPLSPDQILTLQARALDKWIADRRQQSSIVLPP